MNAKSFSNVSENADSFLSPPPGLTFGMQRNPQNQFAIDEEYTRKKFSIYNSELAQKIYDLLWSKGCGLSIREISQQLAIPETSSLTPCAQVGIAVKMFPRTFSLSSNNGKKCSVNGDHPFDQFSDPSANNYCGTSSQENCAYKKPSQCFNSDQSNWNDRKWSQSSLVPVNFLKSAILKDLRAKISKTQQLFDVLKNSFDEQFVHYCNSNQMAAKFGSIVTREIIWIIYDNIKVNGNEHGYYREQISIPYEPRKFESKQRNVRDFSCLRDYEKGKLTNFVSLDEFYIRRYYDEESYEMMLQELRYDYSGALEKCEPQLWMKGDGAAVWIDRKWQRGVVYAALESHPVYSVSVFLIDEGKMITVSTDRLVPLHHHYYHEAPFAICCSIGQFDVVHKIWDEKEKFRVNLIYCGENKVYVPNYFVEEDLIKLRQNY
ncbi:tudor domain protein [Dictyocaulus viviparus]|uniref:Tudor domain protein n=1 Tax=Dictyocaulus viviparus TaxID=29172 RepID=A0A0D8XJ53_DICVI|nr:tudor domain protein [Dictyocaulus viviparus]